MADLERRRNEELARILHQLGWSPERLARELNAALPPGLAISSTAPYKWRDRGMVPRARTTRRSARCSAARSASR